MDEGKIAMKQKTLATMGFDKYAKTTRRSVFLAEIFLRYGSDHRNAFIRRYKPVI